MTEKEKKRLEMYEQRYAESWKKREINEEGTLKPFSKEELEHIFMPIWSVHISRFLLVKWY